MPVRGSRETELFELAEQLADLGCWEMRLDDMTWVWSEGMYRVHGLDSNGEAPSLALFLTTIHPEDRAVIEPLIEQAFAHPETVPPEGIGVDYRAILPDGSQRSMRAIGRVDADPDGKTLRWYGTTQDVTEWRAAERDLEAQYEISQALSEWESFDEGVISLLRRTGTALDSPIGALWTWGDERTIVCRAFWHAEDVDPGPFGDKTRSRTFAAGESVFPGRVFRDGTPWFIPDLGAEPEFNRAAEAAALGLRSALLFPAIDGERVVAALSFYSFDRRGPSERLERTLRSIGHQLGRFLSRRRAQLEPSPLSAREIEVLALAGQGLSGPKIAERLVVSPSTVKTHFENIYDKLGVSDRGGAVAVGLRMGLIT